MYYMFIALAALLALMDGAFSATVPCHLGHPLGGAEELRTAGVKCQRLEGTPPRLLAPAQLIKRSDIEPFVFSGLR